MAKRTSGTGWKSLIPDTEDLLSGRRRLSAVQDTSSKETKLDGSLVQHAAELFSSQEMQFIQDYVDDLDTYARVKQAHGDNPLYMGKMAIRGGFMIDEM